MIGVRHPVVRVCDDVGTGDSGDTPTGADIDEA
jgi:hypothetical protein